MKEIKEILKKISGEVAVEKRIHLGWAEWNKMPKYVKEEMEARFKRKRALFGKYQYIFKSPKGKISLIREETTVGCLIWKYAWLIEGQELTIKSIGEQWLKRDAVKEIMRLLS